MAEVFTEFEPPILRADGTRWAARACGGPTADGMWEGWLEFLPVGGSAAPTRTPRETVQPAREHVAYWATGLTQVYLDGALERALQGPIIQIERTPTPVFDAPAPHAVIIEGSPAEPPRALLDPYEVYAQGEGILIGQLGALSTERLRDVARVYELGSAEALAAASHAELVALILAAARGGPTVTRRE